MIGPIGPYKIALNLFVRNPFGFGWGAEGCLGPPDSVEERLVEISQRLRSAGWYAQARGGWGLVSLGGWS